MGMTTRQMLGEIGREAWLEKSASVLSASSNVFLSHSSKDDADVLAGAVKVLRTEGGIVYADVLDPEAKRLSPGAFGAFFREAIADCGRLVVLLSKATTTSKWVPWELGLADGEFGLKHVAIWPIVESSVEDPYWAKQEYLNIYSRVEWVTLYGELQPCWAVSVPGESTYWRLSHWLALPRNR